MQIMNLTAFYVKGLPTASACCEMSDFEIFVAASWAPYVIQLRCDEIQLWKQLKSCATLGVEFYHTESSSATCQCLKKYTIYSTKNIV